MRRVEPQYFKPLVCPSDKACGGNARHEVYSYLKSSAMAVLSQQSELGCNFLAANMDFELREYQEISRIERKVPQNAPSFPMSHLFIAKMVNLSDAMAIVIAKEMEEKIDFKSCFTR